MTDNTKDAPRNPSEFARIEEQPMFLMTDESATMPTYATPSSACFDFCTIEDATIYPGEIVKLRTGLKLNPDCWIWQACCLKLYARSGLASKGLGLANGVGVIDGDYPGEIMGLMHNTSRVAVAVHKGDRIMQGELGELFRAALQTINPKRTGGFGSTGR
jgi:dUTP pyrophosphatase